MTDDAPPGAFERVLLPLTNVEALPPALAFAARCALALRLPLETLFIEDEDLLTFAGLPIARTTSWGATSSLALDVAAVVHRFGLDARRARRLLDAEAKALAVAARFNLVRAQTQQALAQATRASDLLVFGRGMAPSWDWRAARDLIFEGTAGGLLLLERQARPCQAIVAFYGGPVDSTTLDLAANMALGLKASLTVILVAARREEADRLQEQSRAHLGQHVVAQYLALSLDRVGAIFDELGPSPGQLLIASAALGRRWLEEYWATARLPRHSLLLLRLP